MARKRKEPVVATAEQIRGIAKRVELVLGEMATLREEMKEVNQSGKDMGIDMKGMRKALKRRQQDPQLVEQEDHIVDHYMIILEGS